MNTLYPIKFNPIIKDKVWGGTRLKTKLNKAVGDIKKAGESWELSAVEGDLSVVQNGYLKGNNIEELIEVYMGDLVGDAVYEKFGLTFPLLIKFIDANQYLSVQVHPDDIMAYEKHESFGKTEMWYIVEAEEDAELIVGFNQSMNKKKYLTHFATGTLQEVLNFEKVNKEDVFLVKAGTIHATGPGILFAEIQQTSDVTYRVDDWGRMGDDGKPRELHTELALEALNFEAGKESKSLYSVIENESSKAVKCEYFTVNILELTQLVDKDYTWLDSFVVYMAVNGEVELEWDAGENILIRQGETVLVPAVLNFLKLAPKTDNARLLEIYID